MLNGNLAHKARVLGGVPVWGTVDGSAADQLGLRGGDILLRVNGVQLQSARDFAKGRRCLSQSCEIDVLRCEALIKIVLPLHNDMHDWLHELGQQMFGRASC